MFLSGYTLIQSQDFAGAPLSIIKPQFGVVSNEFGGWFLGIKCCALWLRSEVVKFDLAQRNKEALQSVLALGGTEVALPNLDDVPTHRGEFAPHQLVTLLVTADLRLPEVGACLGHDEEVAGLSIVARMSMPEAAIDQDDRAEPTHNDVGGARQTLDMQSVPIAMGIEETPHQQLRTSVLAADAAHAFMSLLLGQFISQNELLFIGL